MTLLIIDASIAAAWLLPDEDNPRGQLWLERVITNGAFVPVIWHYEVRNVLRICERRGRLGSLAMTKALETIATLPITTGNLNGWDQVMRLSARHNLTIYDAAYLELALRLEGQLATFDRALAAAAHAHGVLANL
ncbi:type II toxin-antitoxin system VapC family toxin [Rhizobium sp. SSA_523]|uniref:type II toxin-antitoxin system VapC family toxin n=1 Tax=Rhizobium sp. SSA_523 TaxID=2952477 RepID=UPI002091DE85|nr:type II toxin-antitoxin system VapC family toxin [Rhizobium sp. SSA_523]MCO5730663.1 type II toxin-antitoxin system VapC family toxin [Rhizobium sp. SSA_523]WKC24508.1 type II toxin-antitoxin system VapC family toxin [Rhizobium sp. SSA_523]